MLIAPLHAGPIDIIGDVHGELTALKMLMERLGYSADGAHPDARRLVFVGDLVDRGEDSGGVVTLVQHLIESRGAQCILGNHELNLLLGKTDKEGNRWFVGSQDTYEDQRDGPKLPFQSRLLQDAERRAEILAFFGALPLALERSDLRVVHAAWSDHAVNALRTETGSVVEIYNRHRDAITASEQYLGARDNDARELLKQNENPVKVLTSGLEARAPAPYRANGSLRTLARVPWWNQYVAQQRVVFGHYWRELDGTTVRPNSSSPFKGISGHAWLGEQERAMCIDYRVGKRYRARNGTKLEHPALLAALRLEREGCDTPPQLIFHT